MVQHPIVPSAPNVYGTLLASTSDTSDMSSTRLFYYSHELIYVPYILACFSLHGDMVVGEVAARSGSPNLYDSSPSTLPQDFSFSPALLIPVRRDFLYIFAVQRPPGLSQCLVPRHRVQLLSTPC